MTMSLWNCIRESMVSFPARAARSAVRDGIARVAAVVELERRRHEEERRKAEADGGSSSIQFKTSPSDHIPKFTSEDSRRRPPNLHAVVLSFPARLLTYVNEKYDGNGPMAYKRAGVRRNVYSRIVSDDSATADKRTVLQFCIGLQLSRGEADLLLKSAGYAFSETIPLDCAIAYCIEHRIWNLEDVNEILTANGLPPIGD